MILTVNSSADEEPVLAGRHLVLHIILFFRGNVLESSLCFVYLIFLWQNNLFCMKTYTSCRIVYFAWIINLGVLRSTYNIYAGKPGPEWWVCMFYRPASAIVNLGRRCWCQGQLAMCQLEARQSVLCRGLHSQKHIQCWMNHELGSGWPYAIFRGQSPIWSGVPGRVYFDKKNAQRETYKAGRAPGRCFIDDSF